MSKMNALNKITIIGLGLIGGSLGLALNKKGQIPALVGYDLNLTSVQQAVAMRAVHWGTMSLKLAVEDADLVILAVPVGQIKNTVLSILPFLKDGCVFFDVGSTKESIIKEMSRILPAHIAFIGGHPMAGSEKAGISGAKDYLFENAIYVITPKAEESPENLHKVLQVIEWLGAKPKIMSPEVHDQAVAGVSHLPYLAAVSLVQTVGELGHKIPDAPLLAAGGFRDTTRIAGGDAVMWRDIVLSNQENLIEMIDAFQKQLDQVKEYLIKGDGERLEELFLSSKNLREGIPVSYRGGLPQIYELLISIPDQPGMLSLITGSLGAAEVNIAEIEVLRVRENHEGAIRLAFQHQSDLDKALIILREKGLSVSLPTA
ncbi:prephenate dehydrogenase [Dehalobacterium formicoaceticum]|uniref:Prephenate dehydrogenase n=1 Tax=Dehalobacterium formicoaceticum TaxID=51515 RepID=A0ABT1Y4R5_9FIRM|nr:prephenate dehydrogenase [Dehalobacterium formicoaceticum]MCR6545863.1 prephenate dehydrogenase [Dehalobacterium formicoaceticum]